MGQIIGRAAKPDACNLRSLSSYGIPAAGQHILVSTDNSAMQNGQGNFDYYIVGNGTDAATALPLLPITPELEELAEDIEDINDRLIGIPDVEWEDINISSESDSELSAYMNANNGDISAQAENLGRKLYFYKVAAGEKYHITGHLYASGTLYTFIGFFAGDTAPVAGNTAQVIEAYAATAKDVNREIEISENGWLILGMSNSTMINRYNGYDWQVYHTVASGGFQAVAAQIEKNSEDIASLQESTKKETAENNVSNFYDETDYAYIKQDEGKYNIQTESSGRQVFMWKVKTGDKFHITGKLYASGTLYTFIAFFAGDSLPVSQSVCEVIEGYDSTVKYVDKSVEIIEDGWLILGMSNLMMTNRYSGYDWQIYKISPVENTVSLTLPSVINAVVGDTIQLFKTSMFKGINPDDYDIMVTCAKGKDFPRYWQHLPVAGDIGATPLKVSIRNYAGQVLASSDTSLVIKAKPTNPSSMKRIAVFGDSLTQAGTWVVEAVRRLTSNDAATATMPAGDNLSNIKFIGAMGSGNARYYGVGGWGWKSYCVEGSPAFRFQVTGVSTIVKGAKYTNNGFTYEIVENNTTNGTGNILCTTSAATNTPTASGTLTRSSGTGDASITFTSAAADAANPLWDGTGISFSSYLTNIGESSVDCVVFLLGWNEVGVNHETTGGYIDQLLTALHSQYPNAIVKILGLQLPSLNGGLAENYGSNGDLADKWGTIRSMRSYNDFLKEKCASDAYSSWVEYVDVASQFDSENNMPESDVQVNTRNAKTEIRGTNGVHPAVSGYYQIADVVYRSMVHQYC